jgi:hypothetical protein
MALGVPAGCKCIVAWIPRWHATDRGLRICRPVSNLSARLPRDALRSRTSPPPVGTDELGRCGAEHGAGGQYVGAALASHGRSHRFDPCHAHHAFLQVSPVVGPTLIRRRGPSPGLGAHLGHVASAVAIMGRFQRPRRLDCEGPVGHAAGRRAPSSPMSWGALVVGRSHSDAWVGCTV